MTAVVVDALVDNKTLGALILLATVGAATIVAGVATAVRVPQFLGVFAPTIPLAAALII